MPRRRKNGPLTVRTASPEEMRRLKPKQQGRGWVKNKRQIGDTALIFGKEVVVFKGGEGGRNWSIPATLI